MRRGHRRAAGAVDVGTLALSARAKVVFEIVRQHVEDAAVLHGTRTSLSAASHVSLEHLRRFDDRIAAHLDGLSVAGEAAWPLCEAALETPSPGAMFAAAVRTIEDKRHDRLGRLFTLAQAVSEMQPGLKSAFGWVDAQQLRGIVADLLASSDPFLRTIGTAASAMHRVDPGLIAARRLEDSDPRARARAYRTAGELGKRELVSTLAAAMDDQDEACQFWAAWSAVLLGDRHRALDFLAAVAMNDGPRRKRAFHLALLAMSAAQAHDVLRHLSQDPAQLRWLVQGAGLAGDPAYIPWLIGHMANDALARIAGESFSLMTGVDLAWLDLERKPPEDFESGPNDDAADPDVEMDPDDGLPWPDPARVQAWWAQHGARFTAGVRHFMGAPPGRDHCLEVLKNGYQRQRIAAACHLCVLDPGTMLFEWRAPAWRQQRELARMNPSGMSAP